MYDLIIRQARLPDGELADIAAAGGRIAAIGRVDGPARRALELAGRHYLSAGWIDGHVHCFPESPIYRDAPDAVGIAGGVTTVVDAGSAGVDDIARFRRHADAARTEVRALLNISRIGLATQHELADLADVDLPLALAAIRQHQGFVVGLKARLSGSVVGQNGLAPLVLAKDMQRQAGGLPLMVHVGNTPPELDDIADLLESGDILTHCFNGKPNRILDGQARLRRGIVAAIERGVLLDVGHGSASFSFEVARAALAQGIYPHTISSDIYCRNRVSGPVYGLGHVMSKFLALGMPLPRLIDCVTARAADALRLPGKGRLAIGADADFTIFDLAACDAVLADSEGGSLPASQTLRPLAAIVAGKVWPTAEGKSHHVFHP
ncbi:amidohydrolase/deacetylase family metallohydrolase [Chromobacterium sp. IIBBL 290-4]|uniref:amidohydrolase/deacetylase family metallohydrolase n=1 Tax=Chromobacterium sp. IIBBL 290-4 TaxID=2953890 RepID=UPI0020B6980C|nr:amidohydrolase/deacetylase family metallohydrolase [Chromobacterium sp. IIBBL 290-4]UTH74710.1 amidohydrolase/deacetylase family metallohydrolase [Chromobacterium sp. IIBBL 290-4]